MSNNAAIVLDATQRKKLEEVGKKLGYEVEELVWDAIHCWLETKAPVIPKKS